MARVVRQLTYESDDVETLRKQLEHSIPDGEFKLRGYLRVVATTLENDTDIEPGKFTNMPVELRVK